MLDTCPRCGTIALDRPVTCPECAYPLVPPPSRATTNADRRRRAGVAAGLIAGTAALGLVATLTTAGDEVMVAEGVEIPLAAPVEREPERVWRWSAGWDITRAVATLDGRVLLSTDEGMTTLLGADGRERWSVAVDGVLAGLVPGADVALAAAVPDFSATDPEDIDVSTLVLTGLSLESGEELWRHEGSGVVGFVDGGVAVFRIDDPTSAGEFQVIDPESGVTIWAVAGPDDVALTPEAVFMLRGDELIGLDAATGERGWAVSLDLEPMDESFDVVGRLAATERFVMVAGREVLGFAAGDGDALWREPGGTDGWIAGRLDDRAYVFRGPEIVEGAFEVFDRRGLVGTIDTSSGDGLAAPILPVGIETDGDEYLLNRVTGTLYDDRLDERRTFDGYVTPVIGGVYVARASSEERDTIAYYDLDVKKAIWEFEVATAGQVVASDDRLIHVASGTVTAYE